MTGAAVSVTETTELADVAMLLETKRIKRVPVLRDGKLVGIVSSAYLVRALAATKDDPVSGAYNDDRQIRERLLTETFRRRKASRAHPRCTARRRAHRSVSIAGCSARGRLPHSVAK